MKVKCLDDSAQPWIEELSLLGFTSTSVLDINYHQVYEVYAMCLWGSVLCYLLEPSSDRPTWFPAVLFANVDSTMPANWHHAFWGRDRSVSIKAVWGFSELVNDPHFFDALSERTSQAMQVFRRRVAQQSAIEGHS